MLTKRDYVYIPLILVLIGMGIFGTCHSNKENRQSKRHIKELERKDARNLERIDSLKANVSNLETKDSLLVSQTKALYITKTNESSNEILRMDADSFLIKLSDYIDRAERNLHH